MRAKALVVLCAVLVATALAQAKSKQMSVQVKEGPVRGRASFLGPVKATVEYADRVTVLKESGSWIQVRTAGGTEGWMHKSALSKKKIVLKAGASDAKVAADDAEVVAAGKGFNEETEQAYRKANPKISFQWIDMMERIEVTPEQKVLFLQQGGLEPSEGGGQ